MTDALTNEQIDLLRKMVIGAKSDALQLGDYTTDEDFKDKFFDERVTHPTLEILANSYARAIADLGQSKLRTEFFVVGREIFVALEDDVRITWGTDPTVQLLLTAKRHTGLRIEPPIHLGQLKDDSGTRSPVGQFLQIVQFTTQMLYDRIVDDEDTSKKKSGSEQLAAYQRLHLLAEDIFALTLRALDANRQRLCAVGSEKPRKKKIAITTTLKYGAKPYSLAMNEAKLHRVLDRLNSIGQTDVIEFVPVLSILTTLPFAQRNVDRQRYEATLQQWNNSNPQQRSYLHYREAVPGEPPTLFLSDLWQSCFKHLQCDAAIYIDPVAVRDDTDDDIRKALLDRLKITADSDAQLVIWDFNPVASVKDETTDDDAMRKRQIEIKVKDLLLRAKPDFAGWCDFDRVERVRSEFNLVARDLFEATEKLPLLPYDCGLALLWAARVKNMKLERRELGDVPEVREYPEKNLWQQPCRVEFQLAMLGGAK